MHHSSHSPFVKFNGAPVETFEHGEKYRADSLTVAVLRGTWLEMGRQYGALLRNEIRKTLVFANRKATAQDDAFFSPGGTPCGLAFIDDLFLGAAQTSGLSLSDLIRCNAVEVAYGPEVPSFLHPVPPAGSKCAVLALSGARAADGTLLLGRNYDWLESFTTLDLVLCILHPSDGAPAVAVLNFAGCFYLTSGMNSHGVTMMLNSGMFASAAYRPERMHNCWLLWQVLLQARSREQAFRHLSTLLAAGAYIITVADPAGVESFEWAVDAPGVIVKESLPGILAMTNHFIQPLWQNPPVASAGGDLSSYARRDALLRLAGSLSAPASVEDLQNILAVEVPRGAKWSGTLFQVIAIPAERRLLICRKDFSEWHDLRISLI